MKKIIEILLIALLLINSTCFGMEKIFYILRNKNSLEALSLHANKIDILISQAYHIDKKGKVTGSINPDLLAFTHQHRIKLMAMVTNSNFDKASVHEFLTHPDAQKKALQFLLEISQQNHFYGIQFDLEMVPLADKKLLTHFYETAAKLFHSHGFIVSFAVAPVISNGPFASSYQKKMYETWGGAYDLPALGKSADFLTVMTYDQHIGKVAPGPVAGITWVEAVIKHVLKYVPANKISLGIPTYSGFWYTGRNASKSVSLQHNAIPYNVVLKLLKKHRLTLKWDNESKVNYIFYDNHWLNEYLFVEDAKSFREKLNLVKKYHLRGISVFRVGIEDPRIWQTL